MTDEAQQIRIIAKPQMNPAKCDFEVDRTVVDGTAYFGTEESAKGSPLAEQLFTIDGVKHVLMRGPSLTVTRSETAEWGTMAKDIGATIRAHLLTGEPCVSEAALSNADADTVP